MPIPSPKEGGKSKRKFTWKSWHRKRWKARANTKRKKAHAAALPLLKESLAVCSLRQLYSWECQSHPPFTLSYYQPPHPQKEKTPRKPKQGNSPRQKHTPLTKQNPQQIQSPPSPFFFLPPTPATPWPSLARFQQLTRRGTIQNSRNEGSKLRTDEVPKPPRQQQWRRG